MKNSASNPSAIQVITQALRGQSVSILPVLTAVFTDLGYHEIVHQRISQQYNDSITRYQGLTRAQHSQFGYVMIKWELSDNHSSDNHSFSDLSHEVNVLTDLEKYQKIKNSHALIAPQVFAHDTLIVNALNLNQQLIIAVMSYYSQGSLAHQLSNKKYKQLTAERKHQLIIQSAHLIANLHNSGWLHNDIKPSNIFLDGFFSNNADYGSIAPRLLLTDFALANYVGEGFNEDFDQECIIYTAGTPAYLAPERWQGQRATKQSDVYAFGIMAYEILIGKRPFKNGIQSSQTLKDWAIQHCQQPMSKLPLEYSRYQHMIDKVLAKRMEKRYQSMEDVLRDLMLMDNR